MFSVAGHSLAIGAHSQSHGGTAAGVFTRVWSLLMQLLFDQSTFAAQQRCLDPIQPTLGLKAGRMVQDTNVFLCQVVDVHERAKVADEAEMKIRQRRALAQDLRARGRQEGEIAVFVGAADRAARNADLTAFVRRNALPQARGGQISRDDSTHLQRPLCQTSG
jgi:hypothetical protein